MHHAQSPTLRFEAALRVQVPRDTSGTLEDGVAAMVRRIDAIEAVDAVDLQGMVPRLNDVAVDATVEGRIRVDPGDEDPRAAVAAALAEGFGVDTVEHCTVRRIADDPGTPALEYG